ncbi:ATP-binding protein (plasmid) [Agrobacterium vitis]|uniref:ATP-binding protein n=1 Tax=Agrobacterium vitis TaxID=373 RepID=UPI003D28FF08
MIGAFCLSIVGAALLTIVEGASNDIADQSQLMETARFDITERNRPAIRPAIRRATDAGIERNGRPMSVAIGAVHGSRPPPFSADLLLIASSSDTVSGLLGQARFDRVIRQLTRPFRALDKRSAGRDGPRTRTRPAAVTQPPIAVMPVIPRPPDTGAAPAPSLLTLPVSDIPEILTVPLTAEDATGPASRADTPSPSDIEQPSDRPATIRRLVYGLIALAFLAMAGLLAFRLKVEANRLRLRLRTEQAVYAAIAGLSADAATLPSTVADVLLRIEDCFGFRSTALVSLDPSTWSIEALHASKGEADATNQLAAAIVAEIRLRDDPLADMTLWRYPDRSTKPLARALRQLAQRSRPDAVASVAWLGDRFGVMLIAECATARPVLAADTQILHLSTQLLAIAIESHGYSQNGRPETGRQQDGRQQDVRLGDGRLGDGGQPGAFASERRDASDGSSALAGGIAHEFNNVLTAIMGYAEMAADALHPGTSPRAYVDHIQGAGARAKLVIDQMLAFSREDAEARTIFDVVAATAEILPDLAVLVPPSVSVRKKLPDRLLRIHGSRIELQQVVTNLCKNAGEAIVDGGEVTLGVSAVDLKAPRVLTHGWLEAGRYVRVSVSDTGTGIAAADLDRIFDPFFTTRSGEGGTGLGLAMVLQTVQAMEGGINVRSTIGSGTRFELFFPRIVKSVSRPVSKTISGSRKRAGKVEAAVENSTWRGEPEPRSAMVWEEQVLVPSMAQKASL